METKELISKTYELGQSVLDSIESLQRGLIYNNIKMLEDVRANTDRVHSSAEKLTEGFKEEAKTNPLASLYEAVPLHIKDMALKLNSIAETLATKIGQGVLFSDRAIDEINFLFEKLKDIISNANDMILARNNIIAGYIKEAEADILRIANDFQTKHEERLIEGLCLPIASPLYLSIVDAVKSSAWHAKEIAQSLKGR